MKDELFKSLGKSIWHHVGLASIFCAGLLLLFVDKLPKPLSEHLLPALIVAGIGWVFLGYIEGTIFRKNFSQSGTEKTEHPYIRFFLASGIWFVLLIAYLFWRGVL